MFYKLKIIVITIILIPIVMGILFMIPIIGTVLSGLSTIVIVSICIGFIVNEYFESKSKNK